MIQKNKKTNFGLIMAVYLLGIFMGALDTGVVTPARTVIQTSMNVSDNAGVWMITIYTLAYAASIPVMGKLADRMGRKYIYIISISLFGIGSLFCGLSEGADSFVWLLIARAVQAIGGGGIMPVATAEFGTTFPVEKRGMALGLVGGVYGIANIFGASVGSAILDLFGTDNWQFIFYINIPITIFIVVAGLFALPNTKNKATEPIDVSGIFVLVVMILALMYGLKNIDFFDFAGSVANTNVYPFLLLFCVLIPVFIVVEKRAADPVMNLSYFKSGRIMIVLILSVMTGIILMGLIFVPQLCENCMKVPSGSGGYFVIILGVFAGIGAPLSGKLTDSKGPKAVLSIGFIASIVGALFLILVTTVHPGGISVIISLILIGLGIGFTMGAPLNYMMLENTEEREANSALATLSLVRSIGTVIAPAIMIGFIAHAGIQVQGEVMNTLPNEISVPKLPYAEELTKEMKKENIEGMPDLTEMETIKIEMGDNGNEKISEDLLDKMKSSDVTTIVANTKEFSQAMFEQMTPDIEDKIIAGVDEGIAGMEKGVTKINNNISEMNKGISGVEKGIAGMKTAIAKQKASLEKMENTKAGMEKGMTGIKEGLGFQQMMVGNLKGAQGVLSRMPLDESKTLAEQLPPDVKKSLAGPAVATLGKMSTLTQLENTIEGFEKSIKKLEKKENNLKMGIKKIGEGIAGIKSGMINVNGKLNSAENSKAQMNSALKGMESGRKSINDTISKMEILKAAVPETFKTAEKNYLDEIDKDSDIIETVFQKTLNQGFKQVYMTVAIAALVGLLLLMLYRKRKNNEENIL